jgi:hypothetical protein
MAIARLKCVDGVSSRPYRWDRECDQVAVERSADIRPLYRDRQDRLHRGQQCDLVECVERLSRGWNSRLFRSTMFDSIAPTAVDHAQVRLRPFILHRHRRTTQGGSWFCGLYRGEQVSCVVLLGI